MISKYKPLTPKVKK